MHAGERDLDFFGKDNDMRGILCRPEASAAIQERFLRKVPPARCVLDRLDERAID